MYETTVKPDETYDTKITLIAAIDEFINKKKSMSQNEKWNAYNIIAKKYDFEEYTGSKIYDTKLIDMINKQISKHNLSDGRNK